MYIWNLREWTTTNYIKISIAKAKSVAFRPKYLNINIVVDILVPGSRKIDIMRIGETLEVIFHKHTLQD